MGHHNLRIHHISMKKIAFVEEFKRNLLEFDLAFSKVKGDVRKASKALITAKFCCVKI